MQVLSRWSPPQIRCSWCWTEFRWDVLDLYATVSASVFWVVCPECGYHTDIARRDIPSMLSEDALERARESK